MREGIVCRSVLRTFLDSILEIGNRMVDILFAEDSRSGESLRSAAPVPDTNSKCRNREGDHSNHTETAGVFLRRDSRDERTENQSTHQSANVTGVVDTRGQAAEEQAETGPEDEATENAANWNRA
jgi:hypothetical protein